MKKISWLRRGILLALAGVFALSILVVPTALAVDAPPGCVEQENCLPEDYCGGDVECLVRAYCVPFDPDDAECEAELRAMYAQPGGNTGAGGTPEPCNSNNDAECAAQAGTGIVPCGADDPACGDNDDGGNGTSNPRQTSGPGSSTGNRTGSVHTTFKTKSACVSELKGYNLDILKPYGQSRVKVRTKLLTKQASLINKKYSGLSNSPASIKAQIQAHKAGLSKEVSDAQNSVNRASSKLTASRTSEAAARVTCSLIWNTLVYSYMSPKINTQADIDGLYKANALNQAKYQQAKARAAASGNTTALAKIKEPNAVVKPAIDKLQAKLNIITLARYDRASGGGVSFKTRFAQARVGYKPVKAVVKAQEKQIDVAYKAAGKKPPKSAADKAAKKAAAEKAKADKKAAKADKAAKKAIAKAKKYRPPKGQGCKYIMTPAVHKATGAKYEFPSSCLPNGWEAN